MIKEDYIGFETAKLLKEKGFDCNCDMYYTGAGSVEYTQFKFNHNKLESRYNKSTLQLVLKWLREVHGYYVHIDCIGSQNWKCEIQSYKGADYPVIDGAKKKFTGELGYDSYEQACEAAIKYCLENLI